MREKFTRQTHSLLACPHSHRTLESVNINDLGELIPIPRKGFEAPRSAKSTSLLVTSDASTAYPIMDGIPILMWPDAFVKPGTAPVNLKDRTYWEAYTEMAFYNPRALEDARNFPASSLCNGIRKLAELPRRVRETEFPKPYELWIDAIYDSKALIDAYEYLTPLEGHNFVQIGGDGRHAVKALLAGAAQAIVVTPMIGEAIFAWRAAEAAGVQDRFSCILGLGEEIPLQSDSVDALLSPGCMHHMRFDFALREIYRVLRIGGRFSAFEPWRAPLYSLGTKVFGKRGHGLIKRSQSVFCSPLDEEKIAILPKIFKFSVVHHHGPILRYPFIVAGKFGFRCSIPTMLKFAHLDDQLGQLFSLGPRWGGSLMFGGQKV